MRSMTLSSSFCSINLTAGKLRLCYDSISAAAALLFWNFEQNQSATSCS